ncbi:TIGR04255 family protein [Pseudomaricurvus sp. HS19]|uniref:TIGR04255 family protein n=1 Tax=Pseudomaricurvus sp. HS19 TaxID=2692626 RepID=UPI001F251369|nr:TIGR04255 family protein [Pseudomaricurvus sp. HS19]
MPFPKCERVIYGKNPLVEVTCQINFKPTGDPIRADQALKIHSLISSDFPQFNIAKKVVVEIQAPNNQVVSTEEPTYEFSTLDGHTKVVLLQGSVAIVTSQYKNWEIFSSSLSTFLDKGFFSVLSMGAVERIGLRYKDVIQRTDLGLEDRPWSELLNPYISSIYEDGNVIANNVVGAQTTLNIKLGESEGMLTMIHGLVKNNATQEQCFLIDGDFFYEGAVEYGAVNGFLDKFHDSARNMFRWCISDVVHRSLQPAEV